MRVASKIGDIFSWPSIRYNRIGEVLLNGHLIGVVLHQELMKVKKVKLSESNSNVSCRLGNGILHSSNLIFMLPHKVANICAAEILDTTL